MRLEVGTPAPASGCTPDRTGPPSRRFDRLELAVLGLFGAVSLWVVAVDLWQVVVNGRVWTGTDGLYIVDQMQYLAWITSASHHLFAANLFVLRSTPADYFQPAVTISGGLAALGLSPTLALLFWKPVAVLGMFFAVRAYAHRSVVSRWQRRDGDRAGAVLRFVHGRVRDLRRARRPVPRLFVMGLHLRAARARRDDLRPGRLRPLAVLWPRELGAGPDGGAGRACCIPGTASS